MKYMKEAPLMGFGNFAKKRDDIHRIDGEAKSKTRFCAPKLNLSAKALTNF